MQRETLPISASLVELEKSLIKNIIQAKHNKVEKLLTQLANANAKCQLGDTALIWAVSKNDLQMVVLLLKHFADPNLPGQYNETPLTSAARLGNKEILNILIEYGATVTDWPNWDAQMRNSKYSIEESGENELRSIKFFIKLSLAIKEREQQMSRIFDQIFSPEKYILNHFNSAGQSEPQENNYFQTNNPLQQYITLGS